MRRVNSAALSKVTPFREVKKKRWFCMDCLPDQLNHIPILTDTDYYGIV